MRGKQVKELKLLFKHACEYRQELYADADWQRYENYWMAKQDHDGSVLTVPIMVSDAQRQLSYLIQDAYVRVIANRPEGVAKARVLTDYSNYLIRRLKLLDQILAASQDCITCGTGFLLDGYGSQYGTSFQVPFTGTDNTMIDDNFNRIEFNENVAANLPWTLRAHPADIYFPPGTADIASAEGFFHVYDRDLEDVRNDEKLNNHRKDITPNAVERLDLRRREKDYANIADRVVLVDWYDLRSNRRVTFAEHYSYALADEIDEILLHLERLPVHSIIFNRNSRYLYGTADFTFNEAQQMDLNDAVTLQSRLGHLQIPKGFYNKNALSNDDERMAFEEQIKKMETDEVMALIGVNEPPAQFFQQFTPQQPYDLQPRIEMIKRHMREFVGMGENQRGQATSGRKTKFEVGVIQNAYEASLSSRKRVIRDVILAVVENWHKLIFDFQRENIPIRTTDAAGNPVVVEFNGADLRDEFQYEMHIESMSLKTAAQRREEANMILSQLMPFVANQVVNPAALVRQYLAHLDTDWNADALMMQQPEPLGPPQQFDQYSQNFQRQQQQAPPLSLLAGMLPVGGKPAQMAQGARGASQT